MTFSIDLQNIPFKLNREKSWYYKVDFGNNIILRSPHYDTPESEKGLELTCKHVGDIIKNLYQNNLSTLKNTKNND